MQIIQRFNYPNTGFNTLKNNVDITVIQDTESVILVYDCTVNICENTQFGQFHSYDRSGD